MDRDKLTNNILQIFQEGEPLETKEVEEKLKGKKSATRTKIFYRLRTLCGEGEIKGKLIGSGKGVWIWWKK